VFIHEPAKRTWLSFSRPLEICVAHSIENVLPILEKVEKRVHHDGLIAAGFIGYEAAPAFDQAFTVRQDGSFPLVWMGLYRRKDEAELPGFPESPPPSLRAWKPSVTRSRYLKAVRQIKRFLRDGNTYQVNYTFRLKFRFDEEPWPYFVRTANAYFSPYSAYVDTGRWAVCSFSPELFFRSRCGEVVCKPMKGTRPRGLSYAGDEAMAESLRQSEKDRAENVMIVDMVRNDMGRVAKPGSVRAERLFEAERHPTVWQMTSTIRCEIDASWTKTMRALFPPASVTGAPKPETMKIIAGLESTPRRIYTGSIGFLAPGGSAQFNVAIRTLLVDRKKKSAEYGVGSGVVWDSEGSGEYEECLLKSTVLTRSVRDFRILETMLFSPEEEIYLLDLHLARMERSAEYFMFPFQKNEAGRAVSACVRGLRNTRNRVRMLLERNGNLSFESAPIDETKSNPVVRLTLASRPVDSADLFLYHKTTNRSVYDEAKRSCPGFDDVLLYNEKHEITESCTANLVAELDGQRITPPVECGLLAGTYRSFLLREKLVHEAVIRIEDLRRCTRLFLVNSVRKEREALLMQDR
jgi:para-aminobenzoate synthetase/4-amino-4-deoxychorismate lyase